MSGTSSPRAVIAVLGLAVGLLLCPSFADARPARLAVFAFELFDTSLQGEIEGPDPAELARLEMIDRELRQGLAASGRFELIDTAPAAASIESAGHLRTCNGCEVPIAASLGADLTMVGWVQKVSNLILNINVTIRDVASRELLFAGSVDIRGNTDESWRRGVRHLLQNRLLAD